jgi:hypothetical protein
MNIKLTGASLLSAAKMSSFTLALI